MAPPSREREEASPGPIPPTSRLAQKDGGARCGFLSPRLQAAAYKRKEGPRIEARRRACPGSRRNAANPHAERQNEAPTIECGIITPSALPKRNAQQEHPVRVKMYYLVSVLSIPAMAFPGKADTMMPSHT